MVLAGQRVGKDRYTIIPRTLSFLVHEETVLLIRIREGRGVWGGKYNGVGGHIEAGEDPLTAARRELVEETGVQPTDLWLAGVILIDTGSAPGIGLFVFTGSAEQTKLHGSVEGDPKWVSLKRLGSLPLVSDLAVLIPALLESRATKQPFIALTTFDGEGEPIVRFSHQA
jgi:8-oxo-dGTP diphosphatase